MSDFGLMPHQKEAVEYLKDRPRILLSFPTGCGKTRTAIAWAVRRRSRMNLIACPPVLMGHWKRELQGVLPDDTVVVLQSRGTESGWDAVDAAEANWVICSLDAPKTERWVKREMWRLSPRSIIIDEAHNLRGHKTQRTKAWLDLIAKQEREVETLNVALLTATPVVSSPLDLASLMGVLGVADYRRLCQNDIKWEVQTVPMRGGGRKQVSIPVGWVDPEYPTRALKAISVARKKEDLLRDLPELKRRVLHVPMREASMIRELNNIYMHRPGVNADRAVKAAMKLMASKKVTEAIEAAGLAVVNDIMRAAGLAKAQHIVSLVESTIGSQKFIIFCKHIAVAMRLAQLMTVDHTIATGEISPALREQAAAQFVNAAAPHVLIATYGACGVGLNLQAGTTAIMAEMDYSPAVETQAIGRIHRAGQVQECQAIRMLCDVGGEAGAFELRVIDAHNRKNAHATAAEEAMG